MFQTKEEDKIAEKELTKMEKNNLPDKEFKVIVIKMITELGRRMDEHSGNFNKELKNLRKFQAKVTDQKNPVTELKNTQKGFKSPR